ncbi:hypothetical protein AGOR_G00186890 [Albula goreensis]|uniref:Endonuclease domain-containing 1 protein-like n=1 Tax=Albula goreensis TaxID=1534307 RepID=A0A8T3CWD9_9TELE|nr:hypothetical protein AGOR_G00186890 [Albula goreensis]
MLDLHCGTRLLRGGCVIVGLVFCLSGGVTGEVGSFSSCPQFFYNGQPPTQLGGRGYPQICQRYHNTYHLASLYHRQWRTPLYSAYRFTAGGGRRPKTPWKYEPQLANSRANPEMRSFPKNGSVDQNVWESQAVLGDYRGSNYTKGHLSPSSHHRDPRDQRATFSLTNIVPQRAGSNSGPWAVLEREVADRLAANCTGPAYLVTGVLPYIANQHHIANRVAVPEYLWSAYCCPSFSPGLPPEVRPFFPTHAAIGRNDRESDQDIVPVDPKAHPSVRGYDVRRMTLGTLEMYLQERLGEAINVFNNRCQQQHESSAE